MFYSKQKTATVWSAACVAVAFALGGVLFASGFARDEEKKTDRPAAAAPAPQPDPKADPKPLEVRKVRSIATDKSNDFRKAVIVASSEHMALLSRNLITRDPDDPKTSSSGLRLWTLDGEKPKRTNLGDSFDCITVGFIPKSTQCYTANWGGITLHDTRTHAKVGRTYPHEFREDTMIHPAVSPDGEILATRTKLKQMQFWNLKTSEVIAPAAAVRGIVFLMAFSTDGKWLFSHDESGDLNVWDPSTGTRAAGPFRHDSRYPALFDAGNYSPKSQQLVTAENGNEKDAEWTSEAVVRSGKSWGVVHRVKMDGLIRKVKWLDDARLLIASEEKPKLDARGRPTAALRHLARVVTFNGEKSEIQTAPSSTVAPDDKHFISTVGGMSCWKLGEPKPIWTKPDYRRALLGDGDWVFLLNKGEATVCSLADGKELWRQEMEKVEDVKVQGSDIWIFTQKAVEVWRVGGKAQ